MRYRTLTLAYAFDDYTVVADRDIPLSAVKSQMHAPQQVNSAVDGEYDQESRGFAVRYAKGLSETTVACPRGGADGLLLVRRYDAGVAGQEFGR
ncbi:MAG: hypothetical protein AABZ44_00920, partial [Elusimicrobiota bacterium]